MNLTGPATGRALLVGPSGTVPDLEAVLGAEPWRTTRSETTAGVLRRLHSESDIDLVLLTPDATLHPYTELCRHIKFDARTALVSVVFVLPPMYADSRAAIAAAEADDCVQLPASRDEIARRLLQALRVKRATDSLEDATAVISSLANAIEGRDAYTRGHVERVGTYSVEIGRRVGLGAEEFATLRTGGVVHDIGKVVIPDQILNKPGKLSEEEMRIVRRHPVVGYDILKPLRTFRDVLPIVRWHHERPNGTGYPDGLRDDQLPLLARIVAVADVFDALSTARSYWPACSPAQCREILSAAAERRDLDPSLVATFLELLDESSVGLVGTSPDAAPAGASVVPDTPSVA